MAQALQRHLEFMSCTPHIVTLLMGITGAMEEENEKMNRLIQHRLVQ